MKKIFYFLAALPLCMTSCLDSGNSTIMLEEKPVEEELPTGPQTVVISTDESATVTENGVRIRVPRGAVPNTNNGNAGRVAFSVDPASTYPGTLPSGYTYVQGTAFKAEPMNFVFASPLTITMDTKGENPGEIVAMRYNDTTGSWDILPFSSINGQSVEFGTLELGYFLLAKRPATARMGGICINKESFETGYYYYLTIDNGSQSKRIAISSNTRDLYMANLPLGTYTVTVSRQHRASLEQGNAGDQYLSPFTVNVATVLTGTGSNLASYDGWTMVTLPSNSWNTGRPSQWGTVTTTYGTGKFQATLTWVNTSSSAVDYDLHLEGPNGCHVYFSNKNQGGFELDRDWLTESGNAIENIYSVSETLPAGEYRLYVHHYSGATGKTYNCRVILDGIVVKSVSGILNSGSADIYNFTIR